MSWQPCRETISRMVENDRWWKISYKNFKKEKRDQEGSDRRRRGPREEWKNLESCHQMGSRRHHDRGGSETCQADVEGS